MSRIIRNAAIVLWGFWVLALPSLGAQEMRVTGTATGEPEVYIAEEGDTLWDICDRFFDDPFYWPVLWSFNPHITNPNWIYPGDIVYLVPPKPKPVVREGYEVTESRYVPPPAVEQVMARRVGFVAKDELEEAGIIKYAREDRQALGEFDEVYIDFKTARRIKVGDMFVVFRPEGKVKHPTTKKTLGYKVKYLGVVKIVNTDAQRNKGVIVRSYEEIMRGDKLMSFAPVSRVLTPVKNTAAIAGTVVGDAFDQKLIGEWQYVIIDKGSKHGVQPGNRFVVRRRGDPTKTLKEKELSKFPLETYGEIIVVDVSDTTSVGLVTYSLNEIQAGDPCELLAGY